MRSATSTNSRASDTLFSSRQCRPMVVVSRKSRSRSAGTRSGRQSTVNCTPVRPFFICTGNAIHIPRARFQQQFAHIGQQLRTGVVDHRFDHRNRLDRCLRRPLLFADQQAQQVGLARACRVRPRHSPKRLMRIAGSARILHIEHAQNRRAGRRHALHRRPGGIHRRIAQQSQRGRRGHRQRSMRAFHRSAAHIQRRGQPAIHAERRAPAAAHTISTMVSTAPTS